MAFKKKRHQLPFASHSEYVVKSDADGSRLQDIVLDLHGRVVVVDYDETVQISALVGQIPRKEFHGQGPSCDAGVEIEHRIRR